MKCGKESVWLIRFRMSSNTWVALLVSIWTWTQQNDDKMTFKFVYLQPRVTNPEAYILEAFGEG